MKSWKLKIKRNPEESMEKLSSAFRSADGFVLETDDENKDPSKFKLHKRVYFLNVMLDNQVVVNGKLRNTKQENESALEISFSYHFLTVLYLSVFMVLGLFAILLGIMGHEPIYAFLFGGISIAIGIVLWLQVQKNAEKNIENYKSLISEILASPR